MVLLFQDAQINISDINFLNVVYQYMNFPKFPHSAMFIGAMTVGKTEYLLIILETEYKNHFEFIVIMCPAILDDNKTYLSWKWIFDDENVFIVCGVEGKLKLDAQINISDIHFLNVVYQYMNFPKFPHSAMFTGAMNVGKTEYLLIILETEYKNHFEFIVIMCPAILDNNKTYLSRKWIFDDENVFIVCGVEEKLKLNEWIKLFRNTLKFRQTLFVIDNCSAEGEINKKTRCFIRTCF